MAVKRPCARDDLSIAQRVVAGETAVFIGDPIKNEYKQLDAMQYEVFSRLDGRRSIDDLAQELKETFDLDVSGEDLTTFIDNLAEMNLLHLASDPRVDDKDGVEIWRRAQAKLARTGVVFQQRARSSGENPPAGDRRSRVAEASHFDQALEHLEYGRVREAAECLRQILLARPDNHRARHLLHELLAEHIGGTVNVESIWWWRIPVINPEQRLDSLDRLIGRFVFTRAFLVVFTVYMLSAVLIVAADVDRLMSSLDELLTFDWIYDDPLMPLLFWTLGPISILGHEMAHGLACRHFGGRVREMGLLFAYLNPTAYCDISSTYLFPDKWKRVLVSMAGPIFTALVWATYVMMWAFLQPDTILARVATLYVWLIGPGLIIETIDPTQKGDTYFALSDLLNAPNLRDDAFAYLRLRIGRILLGSDMEIPEDLHARRRMLILYAVPGSIATVLVIAFVLQLICSYLITNFHTIGLLLSAALLALAVGSPVLKFASFLWNKRQEFWGYRRVRLLTWSTSALALATLASPWPLRVAAVARVQPEIHAVRAPTTTAVAAFLVEPGTLVAAGTPLVRLDTMGDAVMLAQVEAALEKAEIDALLLQSGARVEEIGVGRARVQGSVMVLDQFMRQLDRVRPLVTAGLVSEQRLHDLEAELAAAQTSLLSSQRDLAATGASGTRSELEAARAVVRGLRAQADRLKHRIAGATLSAPVDGIAVLPPGVRLETLVGSVVTAGTTVMEVHRADALRIELEVPLHEPVVALTPGAVADVRLHGLPHSTVRGPVTSVSPAASKGETMKAELALPWPSGARMPAAGLTGNAEIVGAWHPLLWHAYARVMRLVQIDLAKFLH